VIPLLSAVLVAVCSIEAAHAHPLLETASTQVEEAAFDEALLSLEGVLSADALTRAELVELAALRAVVHFALRAGDRLAQDLALLAALDRTHVFGPHLPPALREQFERVVHETEPARVESAISFSAPGALIEASVRNLPETIVTRVQVHARAEGGAWITGGNGRLALSMPVFSVEWYVEVIGPGGAMLLTEGDVGSPRRATAPIPAVQDEPVLVTRAAPAEVRRASTWYWWALGGGTAAAAAITAVAVVFTRDSSSQTEVSGPVLR
jgi:hypothetical protein